MALTPQQQRFAQEYVRDFNATNAAIRAGYSKGTAYSQGSRLLKHVEVQKAISDLMDDFGESLNILRKRFVKKLAKIALAESMDGEEDRREMKAMELLGRHLGMFRDHILVEPIREELSFAKAKLSFSEFCVEAGYPEPFQKQIEMKDFGIEGDSARMILGARGYGKTDYVVCLGVAYKIYLDPSFTCLLITKSSERNAAILKEVANALDKVGVRLEIDNATCLRVSGLLGKDHSMSAATINSVTLRGRHPSLIIMDDPVTPDDTSEAVRKKAKAVYNECMKLKANLLLIGQPVHVFDLYQELRDKIPCMEVPYGSIPELDADLEAQRISGVDEATIQASYFLKVLSEGTVPFDKINYLDHFPEGDAVAFIDPAFGGTDYTAVAILKGHFEGVAVVGFAWKKSWEHCLDDIWAYFQKYRVRRYAFETNKTGDQPLDLLRQAFPGVGVVGIFSNTNKHSRIMAAGSFSHMLHLSKESNKDFIDQTVRYEYNAKNDDAPDAIASCLAWLGLIRGKL